ncbi:MAG TPA: hypothetical protein VFL36_23150 [Myxococcales bacterium]|nr:hypothetical protein [Myxococcales bacterium]
MTKKKDLKRRVRERQERTGESYTAALAQVRGPRVAAVPEATREAKAAGLRCRAFVSTRLRRETDLAALFARLREMLEALGAPACGPLLRGEMAPGGIPDAVRLAVESRRFLTEVRTGARGFSRDGRLFALEWKGEVIVGGIVVHAGRTPLIYLGCIEDLRANGAALAGLSLMGIGG